MFVINANNQQQTDYISSATYGYGTGYYDFVLYGACSCNNISCCNCYNIGDFYYHGYDCPLYADLYWYGSIGGCGTRCCDYNTNATLSIYFSSPVGSSTQKVEIPFVSKKAFKGGEVVGKTILYNNGLIGFYLENSSCVSLSNFCIGYSVGLVHTDGTLSYIQDCCYSCGITTDYRAYTSGNQWAIKKKDVINGNGVIACEGDRIFINSYLCGDFSVTGSGGQGLNYAPYFQVPQCMREYSAYSLSSYAHPQCYNTGYFSPMFVTSGMLKRGEPIQISVE